MFRLNDEQGKGRAANYSRMNSSSRLACGMRPKESSDTLSLDFVSPHACVSGCEKKTGDIVSPVSIESLGVTKKGMLLSEMENAKTGRKELGNNVLPNSLESLGVTKNGMLLSEMENAEARSEGN